MPPEDSLPSSLDITLRATIAGSEVPEPEFTLKKLNTLIKSQLRQFLLPNQESAPNPPQPSKKLPPTPVPESDKPLPKKRSRLRSKYDWKFVIEMLICDTILTCFLPIFFIPWALLNMLHRFLARIYLWYHTRGRVRLMRGQDAFWASESEYNPCNFTSLYIIEGVPDLEKIRTRLGASWVS